LKARCAGILQADSWATDAHKWLTCPTTAAWPFVRDGAALRAAMSVSAAYLPESGAQRVPADHTLELSRRGARRAGLGCRWPRSGGQGVSTWSSHCRLARAFAKGFAPRATRC